MLYCASDLHGISLNRFQSLLWKAGFGEDDFLFVLGDVIDRGDHGVELLRWLMVQPNAELLLGNHEAMLLSCRFLFEEITEESLEAFDEEKLGLLTHWLSNGAEPTMKALRELKNADYDSCMDLLDYLEEAPLYEVVSAGGQEFLLCHTGPGHFEKGKALSRYSADDWLWNRPGGNARYFDAVITVFGHTPTEFLGGEAQAGKILRTDTWIDIDTSPKPCLLRLDDLQVFYM